MSPAHPRRLGQHFLADPNILRRIVDALDPQPTDVVLEIGPGKGSLTAQLAPRVQWVESYVADNKTFCVYLAEDEAGIRKHAELSGFPATRITEVLRMESDVRLSRTGAGDPAPGPVMTVRQAAAP